MAKYADITPFYEWLDSIMKEDKKSYPDHNTLMFYEIIDELDSLPEVVRCKDCKYWHEGTGWCDHHSHYIKANGTPCHPWESIDWKMLDADDFCSYGERKDNERKAD